MAKAESTNNCVCEQCGKGFHRRPSDAATARFCSRQCHDGNRKPPLAQRFARFVSAEPTAAACLLWTGCTSSDGYGNFRLDDGKLASAHRVAYRLAFGDFDEDLFVLHKCDNPPCVNPSHLFLGTNADNMADMVAKGRKRRGERHRCAKLSAEQVAEIRSRYAAGGESQYALAKAFGITRPTVYAIVSGNSWRRA